MGIIAFIILLFIILILSTNESNDESIKTVTTLDRGTRSESQLDRGTRSEKYFISKLLAMGISSEDIFHDLYVEKNNENFAQIDLVVLTKVGIIVVEVKDYSGWIFGSGNKRQWTQVLAYGKEKYRFYNPVMQNNNHILELRKKLRQFRTLPFYSLIVFYGDCVFKDINSIPQGTYISKVSNVSNMINTIIKNNKEVNYFDKNQIIELLKKYAENGKNIEIQNQHVKNIKDMLNRTGATENQRIVSPRIFRKRPFKKNMISKTILKIFK